MLLGLFHAYVDDNNFKILKNFFLLQFKNVLLKHVHLIQMWRTVFLTGSTANTDVYHHLGNTNLRWAFGCLTIFLSYSLSLEKVAHMWDEKPTVFQGGIVLSGAPFSISLSSIGASEVMHFQAKKLVNSKAT